MEVSKVGVDSQHQEGILTHIDIHLNDDEDVAGMPHTEPDEDKLRKILAAHLDPRYLGELWNVTVHSVSSIGSRSRSMDYHIETSWLARASQAGPGGEVRTVGKCGWCGDGVSVLDDYIESSGGEIYCDEGCLNEAIHG